MEFKKLNLEEQVKYVAKHLTSEVLGSIIDHTYLNPLGTKGSIIDHIVSANIDKLCEEAAQIGSSICINESRIEDAVSKLKEIEANNVNIAAVIAFPFGSASSEIKAASAIDAYKRGAKEVDMVLNIGYLKNKDKRFREDIECVVKAVSEYKKLSKYDSLILKVIQENCYLNEKEKRLAARTIAELGRKYNVHIFAKTSTGFGTPREGIAKGATLEDVALMRQEIGDYNPFSNKVGIKAAGGISDAETAIKMMIAAGCVNEDGILKKQLKDMFRIGASAGVKIVEDFKAGYGLKDPYQAVHNLSLWLKRQD